MCTLLHGVVGAWAHFKEMYSVRSKFVLVKTSKKKGEKDKILANVSLI